MTAPYDNFAKFYDLEYGHKENDLDFYIGMAELYGDPVLELGVGSGRVAFELAAAGYAVHGLDNSARMLNVAEESLDTFETDVQQRVKLSQGDMRDFDLARQFPLCIMPFRTFLHNLTLDDQLATLRCIKAHLRPGGMLAFDLFVPLYNVMAQDVWRDRLEPDDLADADAGVAIDIVVQHHPEKQLLNIRNTYIHNNRESESAEMTYRYIFRYEMETVLRLAGFNAIEVYGGFEKQKYDFKSGIMVFVAATEINTE